MAQGKLPPGIATANTLLHELDALMKDYPGEIDIKAAHAVREMIANGTENMRRTMQEHPDVRHLIPPREGDTPLHMQTVSAIRDAMRAMLIRKFTERE